MKFLFVGAKGRMEMEKVPKAGFSIVGLWISGFDRFNKFKNILLPIKLLISLLQSLFILKRFFMTVCEDISPLRNGVNGIQLKQHIFSTILFKKK